MISLSIAYTKPSSSIPIESDVHSAINSYVTSEYGSESSERDVGTSSPVDLFLHPLSEKHSYSGKSGMVIGLSKEVTISSTTVSPS